MRGQRSDIVDSYWSKLWPCLLGYRRGSIGVISFYHKPSLVKNVAAALSPPAPIFCSPVGNPRFVFDGSFKLEKQINYFIKSVLTC